MNPHYQSVLRLQMLFQYSVTDVQLLQKLWNFLESDREFHAQRLHCKDEYSEVNNALEKFLERSQALYRIHVAFVSKKHYTPEDVVVDFLCQIETWLSDHKKDFFGGAIQGIVTYPSSFGASFVALDSIFYVYEPNHTIHIQRLNFNPDLAG